MSESIPLDPERHAGSAGEHATREPTRAQIERRAYEISQREDAGTPEQNWHRAEDELRGRRRPDGPPSE
jgi:hypothetical protein